MTAPSSSSPPVRCANCGSPLAGRYCSSCAQDASLRRISLVALIRRGVEPVQDLDGPLLRTIVGLTLRPGVVVTHYVEGARRRYTNPVKYALIFGAAMVLGIKWDPFGRARLFPELPPDAPPALSLIGEMMPTLIEYTQVFMLGFAPLLALMLWLFFPRTRRNLAEQCTLVYFVYGHLYLLQLPFVLLGAFGTQWASLVLALAQIVWLSWAALRFYGGRPWLTFLRASVPHLLFFVLMNALVATYVVIRHGAGVFAPPS